MTEAQRAAARVCRLVEELNEAARDARSLDLVVDIGTSVVRLDRRGREVKDVGVVVAREIARTGGPEE